MVMFNFMHVKACIILKKLLLRLAARFTMRVSPIYFFLCLLIALLSLHFSRAEVPGNCEVAKIETVAVGLNFVIFEGDVGYVFAGELDSDDAKLKTPLLLNKSRAELPKIESGNLFKKDGFRLKKW